jgi:hypothetical protein
MKTDTSENSQMSQSMLSSFQVIFTNPAIFCLGMSQAFFEGGVYTFGLLPSFSPSSDSPSSVHVGPHSPGAHRRSSRYPPNWISLLCFHALYVRWWHALYSLEPSRPWWFHHHLFCCLHPLRSGDVCPHLSFRILDCLHCFPSSGEHAGDVQLLWCHLKKHLLPRADPILHHEHLQIPVESPRRHWDATHE